MLRYSKHTWFFRREFSCPKRQINALSWATCSCENKMSFSLAPPPLSEGRGDKSCGPELPPRTGGGKRSRGAPRKRSGERRGNLAAGMGLPPSTPELCAGAAGTRKPRRRRGSWRSGGGRWAGPGRVCGRSRGGGGACAAARAASGLLRRPRSPDSRSAGRRPAAVPAAAASSRAGSARRGRRPGRCEPGPAGAVGPLRCGSSPRRCC